MTLVSVEEIHETRKKKLRIVEDFVSQSECDLPEIGSSAGPDSAQKPTMSDLPASECHSNYHTILYGLAILYFSLPLLL